MRRKRRLVAAIYDATHVYDLKVMAGVATYLQENDKFSLYIEENALKDQSLPDLQTWHGDGIIADFDHPAVARAVSRAKLPAVGFGSGYGWYIHGSSTPYFFTDNQAIAQLAADHLLDRGLRSFAFCGYAKTPINGWSEERENAFANYLQKKGFSCQVYRGRHKTARYWTSLQTSLGNWLRSLPKPIGLLAANDTRGRHVLEACRAIQLRVPEQVAIVGVDNDQLLCQLSTPALSSIEQGAHRLGYEAARLLDRMISGKEPRSRRFVIEPVGMVTRQSSDVLAVDDPVVARALAFIHENVTKAIKVPDVVNSVGVSRSGLETRFRGSLGHTIHTAIRRTRMERTRRFIVETSLPLKQIAASTGFNSVQQMTSMFGQTYGCSPARYRADRTISRTW